MDIDERNERTEMPEAPGTPTSRPWATLVLFLGIAILYIFIQAVLFGVLFAIERSRNPGVDVDMWAEHAQFNGFYLSLNICLATLVLVPVILLCARWLSDSSVWEYLGFRKSGMSSTIYWIAIILVYVVAVDLITTFLGGEAVPRFMREAYTTGEPLLLLWLAIVVASPLLEEVLFRGFLYRGLIYSRLGLTGTAVATSALWAVLHMQYAPYVMVIIFIAGVLLTLARHASRSVIPCILMHGVMNLIATAQVAYLLQGEA